MKILYRDSSVLAVRKAPGIHVHPTALSPGEPSLLQALRDQIGGDLFPLHRLDRATSGLLLFALNAEAASRLGADFRGGRVKKTYRALVRGWIRENLEIDLALRDADEREGSEAPEKPCRTSLRPLWRYEVPKPLGKHGTVRLTWVELRPETGRRHQLRRHLAKIAHPVIGDTSYGDRHHNHFCQNELGICFLQLFAVALGFFHPENGLPVELKDSPETEFSGLLKRIEAFKL